MLYDVTTGSNHSHEQIHWPNLDEMHHYNHSRVSYIILPLACQYMQCGCQVSVDHMLISCVGGGSCLSLVLGVTNYNVHIWFLGLSV